MLLPLLQYVCVALLLKALLNDPDGRKRCVISISADRNDTLVNDARTLRQSGFVHLQLLSGPDLNEKFDVIIAPNASSAAILQTTALCSRQHTTQVS